jgi:hypothetical protein
LAGHAGSADTLAVGNQNSTGGITMSDATSTLRRRAALPTLVPDRLRYDSRALAAMLSRVGKIRFSA